MLICRFCLTHLGKIHHAWIKRKETCITQKSCWCITKKQIIILKIIRLAKTYRIAWCFDWLNTILLIENLCKIILVENLPLFQIAILFTVFIYTRPLNQFVTECYCVRLCATGKHFKLIVEADFSNGRPHFGRLLFLAMINFAVLSRGYRKPMETFLEKRICTNLIAHTKTHTHARTHKGREEDCQRLCKIRNFTHWTTRKTK